MKKIAYIAGSLAFAWGCSTLTAIGMTSLMMTDDKDLSPMQAYTKQRYVNFVTKYPA